MTRTTNRHLAGIAAGGALLACALVAFFSLVGGTTVSVWPEPDGPGDPEVVDLQSPAASAQLSGADGLFAATDLTGPPARRGGTGSGADGPSGPGPRPDGGEPPTSPGVVTPVAPEAPTDGSQQPRDDDGGGQEKSEQSDGWVGGLLGDGRQGLWTPVPSGHSEGGTAGLSFPSGPEEGHDHTSWTNEDS